MKEKKRKGEKRKRSNVGLLIKGKIRLKITRRDYMELRYGLKIVTIVWSSEDVV